MNEVFVTNIKSSGTKLFNYSITKKMPSKGQGKGMGKGGGRGGKHGGNKSGGAPDMSRMKEKMYDKLNAKLAYTGYCREGYMESDSYFERGLSVIRGECNESATTADRKKFINDDDF